MRKAKRMCKKCGKIKPTNKKKPSCGYVVPGVYETFDDPFLNNENVNDILTDRKVLDINDRDNSNISEKVKITIDSSFTNIDSYDKDLFEGMIKITSIVSQILRYSISEIPNMSAYLPKSSLTTKDISEEIELIKILSSVVEYRAYHSPYKYLLKINIDKIYKCLEYIDQIHISKKSPTSRNGLISILEGLLDTLVSPSTESVSILIRD